MSCLKNTTSYEQHLDESEHLYTHNVYVKRQ